MGRGADGPCDPGRELMGRCRSAVAGRHDVLRTRGIGGRGQDLGAAKLPLLTHGTAGDFEAGEAQHQGLHRFAKGHGGRWGRGEELTAARELRVARAVGQETEVANPDEAVGHDVEQEAADELLGLERHDLHAITVGVVLPAEADDPVVEAEESVVGEGDPCV